MGVLARQGLVNDAVASKWLLRLDVVEREMRAMQRLAGLVKDEDSEQRFSPPLPPPPPAASRPLSHPAHRSAPTPKQRFAKAESDARQAIAEATSRLDLSAAAPGGGEAASEEERIRRLEAALDEGLARLDVAVDHQAFSMRNKRRPRTQAEEQAENQVLFQGAVQGSSAAPGGGRAAAAIIAPDIGKAHRAWAGGAPPPGSGVVTAANGGRVWDNSGSSQPQQPPRGGVPPPPRPLAAWRVPNPTEEAGKPFLGAVAWSLRSMAADRGDGGPQEPSAFADPPPPPAWRGGGSRMSEGSVANPTGSGGGPWSPAGGGPWTIWPGAAASPAEEQPSRRSPPQLELGRDQSPPAAAAGGLVLPSVEGGSVSAGGRKLMPPPASLGALLSPKAPKFQPKPPQSAR